MSSEVAQVAVSRQGEPRKQSLAMCWGLLLVVDSDGANQCSPICEVNQRAAGSQQPIIEWLEVFIGSIASDASYTRHDAPSLESGRASAATTQRPLPE